jgi:SAM-dependent methyltransferase
VSETEFDRYAADYRATVNEATGIPGVDVDQLAGHKARLLLGLLTWRLGDARSRKVLDVGCGIGLVDAELVSGVGELHGIDTSQKSLEGGARGAVGALPAFRQKADSACRCRLRPGLHDLRAAPSGARDRPAFVAEMARVTRSGGIVAIIEHNPLNSVTRRIVSRCAFDQDAVLLRCGTGARLLAGAGLERGGRAYIAFCPRRSAFVERVEQRIGWLPAGAQYYAWATKGPAGAASPSRPAPRRPS